MQKILRKRILRDLRENLFRYLALGILIIVGMYIIISLVGAADTIMYGTARSAKENYLEDGEFSVFVPLTEEEKESLTEEGASVEEHFYLEYSEADGGILRIFENREKIDRIELEEGRLAEKENEIVLEKRYCEEYTLSVGDVISFGGRNFRICGIGTSADYEAPLRNLSDSAVDSKQFGIGFVTADTYERLREEGKSIITEEYVYAYRLEGGMTEKELKDALKKMSISPDQIEDDYFKEYWDQTGGKKEEFEEALYDLKDGTKELAEGIGELEEHNSALTKGAQEVFAAYLKEANDSLASFGVNQMTEDNFAEELERIIKKSDNALLVMKLKSVKEQLLELKAFADGVEEYTEGVAEASEGADELAEGSHKLQKETQKFMNDYFDYELSNLMMFLTAEDNMRIGAAADDQIINKAAGLVAGVIILILFTYVISVFVVHGIEQEASIIGTLYAMGVKRKELLLHYLTLPVMVTGIAGIIGTAFGYSSLGVNVQMQDCYAYFSVPSLPTVYEPYLLAYGILMPPAVAAFVNYFVIRKKLDQPALKLIRNEQKTRRTGKTQNLRLDGLGFVGTFQLRQMFRELRTAFTVFFGLFVSLLIVMLSLDCYVLCEHISVENKRDTKFAYMYTYKYPEETVKKGGEAAYAKTLKREAYGYNLDVTLLGIKPDNPYFDAPVEEGKDRVLISSAMAQKYHLYKGDEVVLSDEEQEMAYAFTVDGIVQYSTGFYVFMDINSMRELMGEPEDYYNVVFADHDLEIDKGRLYATVTKEEIEKSADIFVELMMSMVIMMGVVSALIFMVVMYLMMKVMIDRSAFSISLMKIFGYRTKEIRKLYLNGNFYIVALSTLIGIPLSKMMMDAMFPYMVSNVACAINLSFPWQLYAGLLGSIFLLYFIINRMLYGKLKKMAPADVLKNRE